MYGGGAEIETRSVPRMYVSASQLDHFLDFITSEHIEIIIRKEKKSTQRGTFFQQCNLLCTETGFAPMGCSTLHKILDVCFASVRN